MATLKNIISTIINVQGTNEANADLLRLNRGVTRLGQASASAGRSFAAQSQGLGGLVAAYAGAAATTFALQQAFDKLAASARTLQTLQGLTTLAAEAGQSAESILNSVREITKGQLTIAETAAQINLTLSAGFSTEQIEGLAEVALKASRALGRDLNDAMTRVVRGSAKMETELLDELGIYTKIDPAVRAYAAALGKSVRELSEFERRQAFANSVIEEGRRKFSAINTTIPNAAEQIEAFGIKVLDLATVFGQFLAETVAPLADFLTNNLAASFATVGLFGALIASKGISTFRDGVNTLSASLIKSSQETENKTRRLLKLTEQTVIANEAIKKLDASVLKLTADQMKSIQVLQQDAQARSLTRREIVNYQSLIQKNIVAINAEKQAILSSTLTQRQALAQTIADRRAAIRTINQINARNIPQAAKNALLIAPQRDLAAANVAYTRAGRAIETQREQLRELNRTLITSNSILNTTSIATQSFATRIAALSGVLARGTAAIVAFGGALMANIVSIVTKPFFFISMFTLIGSSIAELVGKGEEFSAFTKEIGDSIKGIFIDERAREITNAFQGLSAGALTELEKIDSGIKELESITYKSELAFGINVTITKTKEDLVREVTEAVNEAAKVGSRTFSDSIVSGTSAGFALVGASLLTFLGPIGTAAGLLIGGAIGAAIDYSISNRLDEATEEYIKNYIEANARLLEGLSENEARAAAIAARTLRENYGAAARTDPNVRATLEMQTQLAIESARYIDNMEALTSLMNALGVDAGEVARNFNLIDPEATAAGIETAVSTAITSIGNQQITLRFIDVDTEVIQMALENTSFTIPAQNIDLSRLRELVGAALGQPYEDFSGEQALSYLSGAIDQLKILGITGESSAEDLQIAFNGLNNASKAAFSAVFGNIRDVTDETVDAVVSTTNFSVEIISLGAAFQQLEGFTVGSNAAIARSANIYNSIFSTIADGSITLERYNQLTTAGSVALIDATRNVADARSEIADIESEIARITERGMPEDRARLEELTNLKSEYAETLALNEANLVVLRAQRDVLLEQEGAIRQRVSTIEFLNARIGQQVNPIEQYFTAISSGLGETAANTAEIDYFSGLLEQNKAALTSIGIFDDAINRTLDSSEGLRDSLSDLQLQAIFGATNETLGELQISLQKVDDIIIDSANGLITIAGTPIYVPFTEARQQAELFLKTQEALFKIITDTATAAQAQVSENEGILQSLELELAQERLINEANRINLELTKAQNRIDSENEAAKLQIESLNNAISLREEQLSLSNQLAEVEQARLELEIDSIDKASDFYIRLGQLQLDSVQSLMAAREEETSAAIEGLQLYASELERIGNINNIQSLVGSRDLALSVDIPELAAYTSDLDSRISEANAAYTAFIFATAELAQQQIAAAQQQYANDLEILNRTEAIQNLEFNKREAILNNELKLSELSIASATAERDTVANNIDTRLQLLRIEQAQTNKQISDEIELLNIRKQSIQAQRDIDISTLNLERDQQIAKQNATSEELIARYELLKEQEMVNASYFENWSKILEALGQETPEFALGDVEAFDASIESLRTQQTQISDIISETYQLRTSLVNETASEEMRAAESTIELLGRRAASEAEYAAEFISIRERQLENELSLAEAAIDRELQNRQNLLDEAVLLSEERLAAEAISAADRAAIEQELADTLSNINAQTAQLIANKYTEISSELTNFIDSSISSIVDLKSQLTDLQNERVILDIELEIAAVDLAAQIREQLGRANIENIQAQIQLTEAQEAGGLIDAIEAADRVNSLQLKVLAIEEKLTMDRIKSDILTMQLESELLKQRAKIEEASIIAQSELQRAQAQSQLEFLTGLVNAFSSSISGQQTLFQSFNSALAKTFTSAANAVNAAINAALGEYAGARIGAAVAAGIVAEVDTGALTTTLETAGAAFNTVGNLISDVAEQQISNLQTQTQAEQAAINSRIAAAQQEAGILADTAELRRQIQQQDYQNTLADAAGGGGGGGGEDAAEKAAELINSINEKLAGAFSEAKDAIIEIASSLLDVIGEQLTRIQQSRIDTLAAQEELISGAVENTSSRLSEVQSTLNSTLEEEVSLRDQILEQTKALSQAQSDYLSSISSENRNIVQSSEEYVNKLVEQKNSILALSQASVKRTALQREEKSLAEIQISQQQALATTTNARVEAEAKLEQTQQLLSFASELLSGSFTQLGDSMIAAVQKIQTALQMLGLAQDANIPITGVISSILNPAQQALTEFNEEIQNLTELGTSAISSATNSLNSSVEAVAQATQSAGNTMTQQLGRTAEIFGKVSGIISGALTGFQIGGAISQLVGDTGWATTIGGTIGGAIASAFIPAISGFISGVFPAAASFLSGSLGTALLGVAVPIVGSILGALLGSLFKKTPRASASGEVRGGEVNLLSTSASGGARRTTAEALGDIGVGTFESIISSLEQAGLEFTSSLKFSIKMTKDSISDATVTFSDGLRKFSSGALGKGQDAAKAAGEFFVDSFFKGIRVGDVVVSDALVVASDNIQRAIDTFAGLSDEALRTAESFSEAIEFARDFNNSIATLRGAASSTAQVFDLISKAAIANGQNLARSYREFIEETANVFGDSSAQYQIAQQAVRQNALAQAGLAEITVGTTKQLVPLRDALEQVNAGAVLIRETVANIEGLLPALRQAGITNISEVISTGVKQAVETIVGDIGDSLAVAISILQNPAKAAITELEAIIENGEARTRELSGQLNQLSAEQLRGAAITNEAIASARENVTLSRELLGLEIDTYLRSLTAAELEAISATDRLTDAQLALVEAQLAGIRAISNQRALASLLDSSNKINESVAKLTDSFSAINFDNIIGVAVDLGTISESLNRESVDSFTISLRNAIDNIVNGVSSVDNYSASIVAINSEHNDGKLTAEEYASAIEILNSATSEYLDTINDLVDEYESVVSSISEVLEDAKRSVSDSLSTLSDTILSAFRELVDSSADIISTYDDLVADITDAGNSLFDLQDKANDALTEATKAIADFEKENKLSGKTSSQVANELEAVNARIEELLRNPVDLAQFIELSGLTSQQRVLSGELSKLTTLEEEYTTLLEERARAEEDVAGIQSLIEQAGQSLIDSRSKESELMAEASEALNRYLSGQEQLLEINQLLAESNFNINQERAREAEFLDNIRESLDRYNSSLSTLTENITSAGLESSILSAALALGFEQTDLEDAAGLFATLNSTIQNIGSASISQLNDALLSSQTSFDALTSVFGEEQSSAIDSFANALSILNESFDIVNAVDGLSSAIAELNSATDSSGLPQLINNFSDIKQAILNIPDLAATEGSIAAIRDAVSSIGETILDSWNSVKNNFETTLAGSFNVVATIPAGGTLSSSDSATLNSIDNFSGITSSNTTAIKELANLYPREVGVEYQDTYGRFTNLPTFSSGGPVNGPGTSTSDSIHAKLSNGEYVINAASASSIGYGILDILNATGDIRNVLNEDALRIRTSNMPAVNAGEANSVGDIQVNIINNGTSQTVAEQPTIRKENGKFVIDVVLEDLRNNGPIKRQLKSIR